MTGDEFSLALADNVVTEPVEGEQKFTAFTNGTATYKIFGDSAFYTLSGEKVSYTAATADKQFTISGLATDLTLEDGEIDGIAAVIDEDTDKVTFTISESALKNSNVKLSGTGGTLQLDEAVPKTAVNVNEWGNISNGAASYSTNGKAKYYTLSNGQIVYHAPVAGTVQLEVTGLSATAENVDGEINGLEVSSTALTISDNAAGQNFAVKTNKQNLIINLASDVEDISLTGTGNADKINVAGSNITVIGGGGGDSINMTGSGVIQYANGDGNDTINYSEDYTIKLTSGTFGKASLNGNNVVIPVGSGSLTIKDAKSLPIDLIDAKGNSVVLTVPHFSYNDSKTAITLLADFAGTLAANAYESTVNTIVGTAVTSAIEINGNNNANLILGSGKNNTLRGGAGNDTLKGGAGADKLFEVMINLSATRAMIQFLAATVKTLCLAAQVLINSSARQAMIQS